MTIARSREVLDWILASPEPATPSQPVAQRFVT